MIFRMVGVKFYTLRSVKALCSALMNSVCGMCSGSPVRHTQNTFLLLWDVLNFLQFNNKLVEFTIHKKQNTESNDKLIDVVLNAAIDFQPEHKKKPNRYNRFLHTVTAWLLKESAPKRRILSSFTHPHVVPNCRTFFVLWNKIFWRILLTRPFRLHYMGKKYNRSY